MSTPQQPPPLDPGVTAKNKELDRRLELYRLEYERAAIRYEDIYKALWQIFSYLTAISAALLAFGSDRFQENLFFFLVCVPLIFWFWATYWPLNKYGDLCLDRLADIEKELNKEHKTKLSHYTDFKRRPSEGLRVRYIVYGCFVVLHGIFFWNLSASISAWRDGTSMLRERAAEVKIITVSPEELKSLLEKASSVDESGPTGEGGKN